MRKVPRSKIRCTPSLDALEVRDLLSGMTGPASFEPMSRPSAEFAPPMEMDHPRLDLDLVVGRFLLAIDQGDFAVGPAPFPGPDGGWRAMEIRALAPGFDLGEIAAPALSVARMAGPLSHEVSAATGWLDARMPAMYQMAASTMAGEHFAGSGYLDVESSTTSNAILYGSTSPAFAPKIGPQPITRTSALGWLDARRTSATYPMPQFPMSEPISIDYGFGFDGETIGMGMGGDLAFSPMASSSAVPGLFISRGPTLAFKIMGRPLPKLPPMRDLFAVISLYEVGKPEPADGELDTSPMVETVTIIPIGNLYAGVAQALMGGERVVAQIGAPSTPEWIDTALEGEAGANASVNLESLAWQLDAAPVAADAPVAIPDAVAEATPDEGEAPEPREAGLITDFLPVDLAALDESLSRFLDRFDDLNPDLEEGGGFPTAPILIVSAFLTFEATRRYRNRRFLTGNRPFARERSSTLHGFS